MEQDRESDVELEILKGHSSSNSDDTSLAEREALPEESIATAVLSWQEKKNIALLYSLYTIHALPLAFSWFTMPILLRQQLSYTLIGTYLVSQYPYSVKVAWSPLVQSKYLPMLGRRRTWIVPCFFLGGLVLFWLAYHQDDLISRTAAGEPNTLLWLVVAWFILTILCSCLRIALDDWSLDLFSQANVHWASTTTTLSELSGGFFSFNLFLGYSSIGHPNAGTKGEEISTKYYFLLTGLAFLFVSIVVLLTQRDSPHFREKHTLRASYTIILRIIKLPQVWTLMLVHMSSMIGFQTNDAIAILQLVKNGFTDRDIAGLATISIPLEILGGILITKTFRKYHPLHVWRVLFPYRLLVALTTQVGILLVHHFRTHHWRWFIALLPYLASKQFEDMMFIALLSFHAQVADPVYGGIYLPLLATTLNIRYDTMGFIYTKTIGWIDGGEGLGVDTSEGSVQQRVIDGYQIVNLSAVLVAVPVFWFFLRPATKYLQGTERAEWRVGDGVDDHQGRRKGQYTAVAPGREVDEEDELEAEHERIS